MAQPAIAEPADRAKFSEGCVDGVIERGVSAGVGSTVSGIDAVNTLIRPSIVSRVLAA